MYQAFTNTKKERGQFFFILQKNKSFRVTGQMMQKKKNVQYKSVFKK